MRAIAITFAAAAILAGAVSWMMRTGPDGADLPAYWDAPEFALVNQVGDTVRSADLTDRVWIASFIFTNCTDICPVISTRMAEVRDSLEAAGLLGAAVRLVSVSVDPARDTPEVLLEYSRRFGGSPPSDWVFLTGSPPEAVRALVQEGFRVTALEPSPDHSSMDHGASYQVDHSPRILVIDRQGVVRGAHDVNEGDVVARILSDARMLAD